MFALLAAALVLQSSPAYVVVDGMPVGRLAGGKWSSVGTDKPQMKVGSPLYALGLKSGGTTKVHSMEVDEISEVWGIFTGSDEGSIEDGAFLYGRKPAWPRTVEVMDPKSSVYSKELGAYFAKVKSPHLMPRITQILRVDLDGNKSKEVLVVASSTDEPLSSEGKKTDYSIILLRHVVNGKVVSSPLYFDQVKGDQSLTYLNRIAGIADIDGDGNMEIIATSDYYEGGSASIWRLKGGKVAKLAENGVGV